MPTKTTSLKDQILAHHSPAVRRRAELEYDVITSVIRACTKAGFRLHSIYDGEGYPSIKTKEEALRLIFDLDECTLRFKRKGDDRLYGILLVMGNDGWDVVSDYSDDSDGTGNFVEAVEAGTTPFVQKYG